MRRSAEQLPESAIHVIHPVCGAVVLIVELTAMEDCLRVEGICYRCDRYVHLELRTRLLPVPAAIREMPTPTTLNLKKMCEAAIRSAWSQTYNVAKMGELLGVTRSNVYRLVKQYRLTDRRKVRRAKDDDRERFGR